jgi:hypothetical protein
MTTDTTTTTTTTPITGKKVERIAYSALQRFKISELILSEYSKKGLGDARFAEYVSKQLGFEVKTGSIKHYRTEFKIAEVTGKDHQSEILQLRKRVDELLKFITESGLDAPEEVNGVDANTDGQN